MRFLLSLALNNSGASCEKHENIITPLKGTGCSKCVALEILTNDQKKSTIMNTCAFNNLIRRGLNQIC